MKEKHPLDLLRAGKNVPEELHQELMDRQPKQPNQTLDTYFTEYEPGFEQKIKDSGFK